MSPGSPGSNTLSELLFCPEEREGESDDLYVGHATTITTLITGNYNVNDPTCPHQCMLQCISVT